MGEVKCRQIIPLPLTGKETASGGTNGEDAIEHIDYFLKIVDPIKLPNVNYERIRLAILPISLVGNASEWFDEFKGSITSWVDLTEIFFGKYYPPSHTGRITVTKVIRDPSNSTFKKWLALKFANHMIMDPFTKKVLWDFWTKSNDQEGVADEEFPDAEEANNDDEQETTEIFRIKMSHPQTGPRRKHVSGGVMSYYTSHKIQRTTCKGTFKNPTSLH
ncbi:hypothetical protein Tco_0387008 [Tanacetum coccineum]